jgi:hypothetical protein
MIGLCIERLLNNKAVVKNNRFKHNSNTVMIILEPDQARKNGGHWGGGIIPFLYKI